MIAIITEVNLQGKWDRMGDAGRNLPSLGCAAADSGESGYAALLVVYYSQVTPNLI